MAAEIIDLHFLTQASQFLGLSLAHNKLGSSPENSVYRLTVSDQIWFLKIGPKLDAEYRRLEWLQNRLPVPKPLALWNYQASQAILLTSITGNNLAQYKGVWPVLRIVERLAYAIRTLNQITPVDFPFKEPKNGNVLIHGDACLPNFIFTEDGVFRGYVDLGQLNVGSVEADLAAAVWSLHFNFGPGYGLHFIEEYGIKNPTPAMVEELRQLYTTMILYLH